LYLTGAAFLSAILGCAKASSSDDAAPIIALTREALDHWGKGDVQKLFDLYAPGITYFDPFQQERIEGIEAMRKIYAPLAGKVKIAHYEIIAPKVQHFDDVAILTFNLVDDVAEQPGGPGNVRVAWNCTQVYVRSNGKWRVVHEHWSFIKPELKTAPQ
jgi:ketosteroid isomerase-like protein